MSNAAFNRMLERLTDNFNKNPGSNVSKLMRIAAYHIQENRDVLTKIKEWQDIDQAEGHTLDRHGRNVGQSRGQASDEVYRVLIKSKIKRNLSNGSIDTIIDFLAFLLQVDPTVVEVRELWEVGRDAVLHVNVPGGEITKTGLTLTQFGRLVNLVTASGVKAEVLFEGTFAFSSNYTESEYDRNTGFLSADGTAGGTLGYTYDPEDDIDLPI
ncbi:hypothetical protein FB479_11679 [Brevibacillus sp. AG162]|uniref:DUF2612 domain-containing protein n=1 Tax=Brevibacillus sp. AG162 TaxID=2572910 RepID=UPI00114F7DB1|nr:DUF2612 domain-containing protein [Brevibacillus sp. AG162]TQK41978.1 hypothetical protein FB479_11679 [Brevibacillus sp. AG162]